MENLKFRCSSLADIANGKAGLTENQEKTLNELLAKIKLTEKQAEYRDELISKRDAPLALTQGGKSAVELIIKQLVYGYKVQLDNKYLTKGNLMEEKAIELLSLHTGIDYKKNGQNFKNDFITGTPDIIHDNKIIDIKCPWSKATFPLFSEEAHNTTYEYQMRGYMMLTGCESAEVTYCLMTTPDKLRGFENNDLHDMEDLDLRLRFTTIKYERDLAIEKQIIEKVKVAREYANEFYNKLMFKLI
jgi:hypothetical protein